MLDDAQDRLLRAHYIPELSHPILDVIFAVEHDTAALRTAIIAALDKVHRESELCWLYADLICALNGTDWLPLVAGLIGSGRQFPSATRAGGKYDAAAAALLVVTNAAACAALVHDGSEGHGFAVAVNSERIEPKLFVGQLPDLLRGMADEIEQQTKGLN